MKSIIYQLHSDEFPRIKIGVGAPEHADCELADYVLGRFRREEIPVLEESIIRAVKAAETIIRDGAEQAMNRYNN